MLVEKKKSFRWRLKVPVSVSSCSDDGRLFRHRKINVLQTSDACAAVRIVDCWWNADEDVGTYRLMRWRSFADKTELVLYELVGASVDIISTRFAVRLVASGRFSKSGWRDHADQTRHKTGCGVLNSLQWCYGGSRKSG